VQWVTLREVLDEPSLESYQDALKLYDSGEYEDALAVWDELADSFQDAPPEAAPWLAFNADVAAGLALRRLERAPEARERCREVVERLSSEDAYEARDLVARALRIARDSASDVGDHRVAISLDDELLDRFWDAKESELRLRAAWALSDKVWHLMRIGRIDEAIHAGDRLAARFSTERNTDAVLEMGAPLLRIARTLVNFNPRAAAPLSRLIHRLRSLDLTLLAAHLRNLLPQRRARRKAIEICDLTLAKLHHHADGRSQALALEARALKSVALAVLGHPLSVKHEWDDYFASGEAVLPGIDELIERQEQESTPDNARLASLLHLKSAVLRHVGRPGEATAEDARLLERFRHDPSPIARAAAAAAKARSK
jgi:tetratricopeptide (TPR) repeat protein